LRVRNSLGLELSLFAIGVGIDLPDMLPVIAAFDLCAFDRHFDDNLASGCAGHLEVISSSGV